MHTERDELIDYHLRELDIALTPGHPAHALPPVGPRHRAILDIGCGAGQSLIPMGVTGDRLLAGIDIDERALGVGRSIEPRIAFARGLGESLPFGDACFDLVLCRVALPYMRVNLAVAEMARVLRPGGDIRLLLHPWRQAARELVDAAAGARVKNVLYRLYVIANGLSMHATGRAFSMPLRPERHESFQTERTMRRALSEAGFTDIRFERRPLFIATARRADD